MDNFDPQKVYTDAIELYQNKKYRESIKLFNKILKNVSALLLHNCYETSLLQRKCITM